MTDKWSEASPEQQQLSFKADHKSVPRIFFTHQIFKVAGPCYDLALLCFYSVRCFLWDSQLSRLISSTSSPNNTDRKKTGDEDTRNNFEIEICHSILCVELIHPFSPYVKVFLVSLSPPQKRHKKQRDGSFHSSPAGRFSSILLINFIRISVTLSPRRVS